MADPGDKPRATLDVADLMLVAERDGQHFVLRVEVANPSLDPQGRPRKYIHLRVEAQQAMSLFAALRAAQALFGLPVPGSIETDVPPAKAQH